MPYYPRVVGDREYWGKGYDELLMDIVAQEFEGAILKGLLPTG